MQHSCDINDPLRFSKLAVIQKMRRSKEVTLKDLKENRHMLSEDDSYYFKGIVDKITNKSSIWYDACKKCNTSCRKNEGITMCVKCNEEFVETTPRYRITANVIESGYNARVTMFDEVAALYVGCPVKKYISSISEGENDSKYYRGLSASTEICFITALNLFKIDEGGNLDIIANGIQKMQSTENIDAEEESKKDEEEEDKAKCTKVGRKKKIATKKKEESKLKDEDEEDETPVEMPKCTKVGRKKKIATKKQEESKLKDEDEDDKTPVEMPKCTKMGRKKKITTKAQPKEVQDKKRRRNANKKFDDYIEIPSDDEDEVPLAKLISESKKNKSPPLKKIKQEKN